MLSSTTLSAIALSMLLLPSSARVVWVPEDFELLVESNLILERDTATCGGDASLNPCGGSLPADFCCPSTTICLALSTINSVQAAICCPKGQDCTRISPVSCNINLQNITNTQLHVNPPQPLKSCGGQSDQCCPMGYTCKNSQCIAQTAPTPVSQSTPTSTGGTSSKGSGTSTPTSTSTNAGVEPGSGDSNGGRTDSDFNGKSFAAGFIPGIVIGAIIAALIIFCCCRKKRKSSKSYVEEKTYRRDTLTDLGTIDGRHTHGRNISDPQAHPSNGYRTDFLRHSPPRPDANGYSVSVRPPAGPITPPDSPPKIQALFTRSPFMADPPSASPLGQPPVPAHLKRNSLSFKISPVRALKKQKSTHSLRRQMTESSQAMKSNSRKPHLSRTASTETIQVLMPSNEPYTPDRPQPIPERSENLGASTYQPGKSAHSTWNSSTTDADDTPDERQPPYAYASSSRYPSDVQPLHITPTRPPVPRLPIGVATGQPYGAAAKGEPYGWLASPYTPTREPGGTKKSGGLAPPSSDHRRDTTFSAMMEKAGLRKSDLLVGAGSRKK